MPETEASVSEEMDQINIERQERNAANTVFGELQRGRETMLEINGNIQEIVDKYGNFGTLPTDTKQAYLSTWQVIKDAIAGFNNPVVKSLLDWKPS